jgi:predicted TIM-barrel fold metal-dependent hydrolase
VTPPSGGGIIDVHSHCFSGPRQADTIARGLEALRREGLRHMVVVGLVNTHLDAEEMWNLIPEFVENRGDSHFYEVENLLALTRQNEPVILPFVDTRHLWAKDVAKTLRGFVDRGFRGIKGIYLADDGNDLGVGNVPDTFGISLAQYQRREREIFAFAEAHDLPLVYHMDVRRYGDLVRAWLEEFPRLRVDFPHFGIGRKAMGKILEHYPNVYTDLASMLPHMRRDPASYRDFIMAYPDRVCFGSDALLYASDTVLDYIRMVRELALPDEIEAQVFSANPVRFLGRALEAAEVREPENSLQRKEVEL